MKKKQKSEMSDDLRPEYDMRKLLKGAVRGKSVERYRNGTNLVLLEPDVAKAFAYNSDAINEALRLVIQLVKLPQRSRSLTKS